MIQNSPDFFDLDSIFEQNAEHLAWQTLPAELNYRQLQQKIKDLVNFLPCREKELWLVADLDPLETFAAVLAGMTRGSIMVVLPSRTPASLRQLMLKQAAFAGVISNRNDEDLNGSLLTVDYWKCIPGTGTARLALHSHAPAFGILTSGSTGLPKIVIHSWANLWASAQTTKNFYGFTKGHRWLLSLDLGHIGGFMIPMRSLAAGACCSYFAEPASLAESLKAESFDFISLVPTQLHRLMALSEVLPSLQKMQAIVLGGAAASWELIQKAQLENLPLSIAYGASETAAQCIALKPGEFPREPGEVGCLLGNWEKRIEGEKLFIRGDSSLLGYFIQNQLSSILDADGWLMLPDRFRLNGDRFIVLGRLDGQFQVAGENVSVASILAPLELLRANFDFTVIPQFDLDFGFIPLLVVRGISKPDPEAILNLWGDKIIGLQRPRKIFWDISDSIQKPSLPVYRDAIERGELQLLWSRDEARI